jgi:hypothetical protein
MFLVQKAVSSDLKRPVEEEPEPLLHVAFGPSSPQKAREALYQDARGFYDHPYALTH